MVGIVVVSHSEALAKEAIALAMQMAQAEIKVVNAAGTTSGTFGTDAVKIMAGITEAASGQGVVLLVDLGSAVMSTELAIEMLGLSDAEAVIANAPLVEGLIAAVTSASIGMDLASVCRSAEEALLYPKVTK